jgi:large subunit ribosomal protein L30e
MAKEENEDKEAIEAAEEATEDTEAENAAEETVGEAKEGVKKRKVRKVVRRRKSKKEKEKPLTAAIRLAVENGEVGFGARKGTRASLLGKAKLFVIASNAPDKIRDEVSKYATASGIPVITFEGSSLELGSVCGKPFSVSVLSVYDPKSSPIMDLIGK